MDSDDLYTLKNIPMRVRKIAVLGNTIFSTSRWTGEEHQVFTG